MLEKSKSSLQSGKLRILITVVVVASVVLGFAALWHYKGSSDSSANASLSGAPAIDSIPGAGNASAQYVKDQHQDNAQRAQAAIKKGGSSVSTITRSDFQGSPDAFVDSLTKSNTTTACPLNNFKPNPNACTQDSLQKARQAGVTVEELRCQGCACPALKQAGYSAGELKSTGMDASALRECGFTLNQLMQAGFSAKDLKAAGYTAKQLADAGFSAADLKAAGFTAKQLADAGFTAKQLAAAGFSKDELAAAGLSQAGATAKPQDCSVSALKQARANGATAKELRNKGCGLAALKAAGYTASELKAAGYTAGQLKDAGFTAAQLKAAGFSAKQLRDAGFSAADLKKAGFTAAQLKAAGFSKGDLLRAGFTPEEAGYVAPKAEETPAQQAQTGSASTGQVATSPNNIAGTSVANIPTIDADSPEAKLARLQQQQQERLSRQQRQDLINQQQGAMAVMAQKLMAGWTNHAPQTNAEAAPDTAAVAKAAGSKGGDKGESNDVAEGKHFKAGDLMFGVLVTSVNTDEKTPVMANIVDGPLKGSKLVGNFKRVNKRVLLSFTLLNIPGVDKSVPVNIVAIDPDTARTAMSGDVNNHYLLRYGTLFASAFIAGVGDAVAKSGAQVETTPAGTVVTYSDLNVGESALIGAGNVGKQLGSKLSPTFNTPPTVKIDGGTGMGLLVMSDFTMPLVEKAE